MAGGGVLGQFFAPGIGVPHFLCARAGVGNCPVKKISGFWPGGGGWSGLELTDTLSDEIHFDSVGLISDVFINTFQE